MEKMLNTMLNVQKDMALEKKAIELSLEIISEALEETVCILQDLISEGKFEEAKGLLDECSNIQQEQEDLEILLVNKQSDYAALEGMIKEAKHLVSKYEIDDTECEEEETFSLEDFFAAIGFTVMK